MRRVVINAISTPWDEQTLGQLADSAGINLRTVRRKFGRRKVLFEAVTESVIHLGISVARNGHTSAKSVEGIVDALVWHRISVYHVVAEVLPAVRAGRAGVRPFGHLEQAAASEAEFLVRRMMPTSTSAPCQALLSDIDDALALCRVDDLSDGGEVPAAVVSSILRADLTDVFEGQAGNCLQRPASTG